MPVIFSPISSVYGATAALTFSNSRVRSAMNLGSVSPALDDVVQHAVEQRHVGARRHLEVDVGQLGELDLPDVGHDQLGARGPRPA